jgi:nicotinamidase-related amidase
MTINPSAYPAYASECGDPSRTKTLGFGLQPAVVLVDVCGAYMSPSSPIALSPNTITSTASAIGSLLKAARTTPRNSETDTVPVFYAQTVYTHPQLRDAGLVGQKQPHVRLFLASHPDHFASIPDQGVYAELQPRPLEMVHHKKFPSAFFATNFATQLAALGVDTVIIGGFLTSVAVRSTAIDAMQAGFRSIVVAEACADRGRETHWANLMDHNAKYGDVVGLEEAIEAIKKGWSQGLS